VADANVRTSSAEDRGGDTFASPTLPDTGRALSVSGSFTTGAAAQANIPTTDTPTNIWMKRAM